MNALVVDASVWVAAADAGDHSWELSRSFLTVAAARDTTILVPAFAEVEIACALARRTRDSQMGRKLSSDILQSLVHEVRETDSTNIRRSVTVGTDRILRGGDALYAALADSAGAQLVSWDNELVSRANAITPEMWLEKHG